MGPRAHSREATLQGVVPSGCGAFLTEPDAWGGAWGPRAFPKAGSPPRTAAGLGLGHSVGAGTPPPHPSSHPLSRVTLEIPACTPAPIWPPWTPEVTHTGRESRGSRRRGDASQPGLPASPGKFRPAGGQVPSHRASRLLLGPVPICAPERSTRPLAERAGARSQLILRSQDLPGWGWGSQHLPSHGGSTEPLPCSNRGNTEPSAF